ncbi:unnamed protein product [Urochloa decumbens]|uniref:F-box domain-containing protein n=1 Tax=Urochloa decumbens TaxID=240449 RepID=A0ABC8WYC1_9POAL
MASNRILPKRSTTVQCLASMEPGAGSHGGVLPDDVLRQIFVHLTARVVCRFRAACKSWRALASEPDLLRAHARRAAASSSAGPSPSEPSPRTSSSPSTTKPARAAGLAAAASPASRSPAAGAPAPRRAPGTGSCAWSSPRACTRSSTRSPGRAPSSPPPRCATASAAASPHAASSPAPTATRSRVSSTSCTGRAARARTRRRPATPHPDVRRRRVADTATLQTVAGHNWCASSATVHGRLHWRDMLRGQEELLVFDTLGEEFGAMPLPQPQELVDGEAVTVQQTVTTMSGKLCLLLGLAERTGAKRVEVWVLEDYLAQEWRLRQRLHDVGFTPLHKVSPSRYLGNVGLITAGDRVEKMVFCNGLKKKVYDFQRVSLSTAPLGRRAGIAIHTESPVPQDVVFGAAPTQGVAPSTLIVSSQSQQQRRLKMKRQPVAA